jgi:hypothetical protein
MAILRFNKTPGMYTPGVMGGVGIPGVTFIEEMGFQMTLCRCRAVVWMEGREAGVGWWDRGSKGGETETASLRCQLGGGGGLIGALLQGGGGGMGRGVEGGLVTRGRMMRALRFSTECVFSLEYVLLQEIGLLLECVL